jgi:tetrahydromethanopterin S-methyltransferase subunit F
MLISNKPNIRGIRKVAADVKYRTQLIGRDQRLFAGLIATRLFGMAMGFLLAVLLIFMPLLWTLYGWAAGIVTVIVFLIFLVFLITSLLK